MLSSTELQPDFDSLTGSGFFSSMNYSSTITCLYSEYGNVYNVRILTSSEAPVARQASLASRDIYINSVVGKQAVTHIGQDGDSMQLLYRGPEFSGMLMQNSTLAVRFPQSQLLTQDTAIRNLLSTRAGNSGGV